jgi:hypothetical protein
MHLEWSGLGFKANLSIRRITVRCVMFQLFAFHRAAWMKQAADVKRDAAVDAGVTSGVREALLEGPAGVAFSKG